MNKTLLCYIMNIHPVIPSYFVIFTYILMYVMYEEFTKDVEDNRVLSVYAKKHLFLCLECDTVGNTG